MPRYKENEIVSKLEEINLNHVNGNQISEIPHGAFSGLHKLKRLSLVDNKLIELTFEPRHEKTNVLVSDQV